MLLGINRLSSTKLQHVDMLLNHESEKLLAELDQCQKRNEYPDTGKQLTSTDIEEIPWLLPDTILKSQGKDRGKENKNKNVKVIITQQRSLKHSTKLTTSNNSENEL